MNHIYRSIWNATLGVWVAAPENARAAGKRSASVVSAAPATVPSRSPARTPVGSGASLRLRPMFNLGALALCCALAAPQAALAASLFIGSNGNGGAAGSVTVGTITVLGGGGGGGGVVGGGGGGGGIGAIVGGGSSASAGGSGGGGGGGGGGGVGGSGGGDSGGGDSGGGRGGGGHGGVGGSAAGLSDRGLSAYDWVILGGSGGGGGGAAALTDGTSSQAQSGGQGKNGGDGGYSLTQNITVSLGVQLGGHGGAGGGESYAKSNDGITSVGYGGAGGQGGLGELTVGPWRLTVTGSQVRLQLGGNGGSGYGNGGNGGSGGNGILTVQPGGTVVVDNGAQLVLGGAAGTGGSKGGAGGEGILNLAGVLEFSGTPNAQPFAINAKGELNIGNATSGAAAAGRISGLTTLTNNGVIRFNQSDSTYTFATAITGSGHLEHNAAGTTTLTGANTYTGGTTINAGTLVAANNQALGTGDVTVGDGAALEVAQTTTLSVGGNLTFDSGSSYRVSASDGGSSSRIDVAGTANLAGGVLHVGPTPAGASDFKVGQTYTILKAGTLTGKFDPAKSDFAYLNAALGYKASVAGGANDTVTLTLERNDTAFADLAQTSNQAGVANAVEGMDSSSGAYNYVQQLSAEGAADALARLSGDSYANTQAGLRSLSRSASHLGPERMQNNLVAGYRPGAAIAQSDGPLPASAWPTSKALPAWAEVVGQRQSIDGDGNAAKLTQNVYGLFVGADEEVGGNGWRVGGSLGFTKADAKTKARDASADTKSYSASVYTGKGFSHGMNRVNVMGGLAYTHHRISSDRTVAAQNLKSKYSAHTTQLFGEVGYAMGQYSKQGMEPFAGINITQQRVGSFQETGGFAALRGQSSSDTTASTTLGVRAHSDFKLAGKDARLKGTVGWRHAWGDVKQTATMSFEGSSSFTVAGAPLARNTALLGLQAEVELSRRAALELGYQGEYGSGMRDHAVNVKMRWAY